MSEAKATCWEALIPCVLIFRTLLCPRNQVAPGNFAATMHTVPQVEDSTKVLKPTLPWYCLNFDLCMV